jgi:hypothetical protein
MHALNRLARLALQADTGQPFGSIQSEIADAIHWVAHIERRASRRQITELIRITGFSFGQRNMAVPARFRRGCTRLKIAQGLPSRESSRFPQASALRLCSPPLALFCASFHYALFFPLRSKDGRSPSAGRQ